MKERAKTNETARKPLLGDIKLQTQELQKLTRHWNKLFEEIKQKGLKDLRIDSAMNIILSSLASFEKQEEIRKKTHEELTIIQRLIKKGAQALTQEERTFIQTKVLNQGRSKFEAEILAQDKLTLELYKILKDEITSTLATIEQRIEELKDTKLATLRIELEEKIKLFEETLRLYRELKEKNPQPSSPELASNLDEAALFQPYEERHKQILEKVELLLENPSLKQAFWQKFPQEEDRLQGQMNCLDKTIMDITNHNKALEENLAGLQLAKEKAQKERQEAIKLCLEKVEVRYDEIKSKLTELGALSCYSNQENISERRDLNKLEIAITKVDRLRNNFAAYFQNSKSPAEDAKIQAQIIGLMEKASRSVLDTVNENNNLLAARKEILSKRLEKLEEAKKSKPLDQLEHFNPQAIRKELDTIKESSLKAVTIDDLELIDFKAEDTKLNAIEKEIKRLEDKRKNLRSQYIQRPVSSEVIIINTLIKNIGEEIERIGNKNGNDPRIPLLVEMKQKLEGKTTKYLTLEISAKKTFITESRELIKGFSSEATLSRLTTETLNPFLAFLRSLLQPLLKAEQGYKPGFFTSKAENYMADALAEANFDLDLLELPDPRNSSPRRG